MYFLGPEPAIINVLYGWSGIWDQFGLCYFIFWFVSEWNLIIFWIVLLYCYIYLICSFSLTRSLLVPYAYVSIKSVDCILLSSFELKAIWLISSLKTYLSLLNLGCVFDINFFFFFMNSWWSILRLPVSISFLLDGSFYSQVELLLNSFYNFQI